MSKTLASQSMSVKYLGGSKQPAYLPRIENWNIIPAPGEDADHFWGNPQDLCRFLWRQRWRGKHRDNYPFYFTGKLIMSDERRKDAKPITLSNIVRLEKILLAYGNGLVRIYTSTDKIYYFYFEGWSTEARSMMRRLSTRRSIYSSCIPSQKQIKLRRRETIYRPTLNLIDKKKINMD